MIYILYILYNLLIKITCSQQLLEKLGSGFNNNTEIKTIYGNGIHHTYKYYKSL